MSSAAFPSPLRILENLKKGDLAFVAAIFGTVVLLVMPVGPVVLVFCLQLGMVLTGTVLTEAVFGWPGVGSLLVEGLNGRDYPLVQGCLILISVGYGLAVLLADVLQALLDPRLRGR